jgi:glycosyltransferase involved in cell wall biosynthesis
MDTNKKKLISICIPTYEMGGKGPLFLAQSFDILLNQTFKDFDIIISDNAEDGSIKKVCEDYENRLDIQYYKHAGAKEMCANTNNAMLNAKGLIIKILFMDDFLYDENSLKVIADNFDINKDHWLATACVHTNDGKTFFKEHYPTYHDYIQYGRNTIGTPSVIAIKNENIVLFESQFKWTLQDCDYYKSAYNKFGAPKILNIINVVIRIHENSVTSTQVNTKALFEEFFCMLRKHNKSIFSHPEILLAYAQIWRKKILSRFRK